MHTSFAAFLLGPRSNIQRSDWPLRFRDIPVPTSSDIICLLYDELSVLKALGRLLASEGLQAEKLRVIGPPRASARPRRFDFEKKVETSRFHTQPSQHNHESDVGQRIWNV